MATTAITTASEAKEWVLACNEFEQCEIETLKGDVSFIESELIPPIDPKETNSMYFLENIPRNFSGDGKDKLWVFIDNKSKIRKRPQTITKSILGSNDLGIDSWGRQKVINDYSQFHGMFTLEISDEMWLEIFNGVEQPKTNAISVNGMLELSSGNGESWLMSKRHPRYQPNRGLLYSDSGFVEGATKTNGKLYAMQRTLVDGVVLESEHEMNLSSLETDLSDGHVRDIQAQWRGVGDMKYFVDLTKIYDTKVLGTLKELSVFNPALPISFQCTNQGIVRWGLITPHSGIYYEWRFNTPQETKLRVGCVDLTSEGGEKERRQRGAVDSDEISLGATETAVIVIHLPNTIDYNGIQTMNTRDVALRLVSGFADDNTIMRVYTTRDLSKFNGTIWADQNKIGSVRFSVDGSITIDDLVTNIERIATRRIPANGDKEIENPDEQYGDFYLTHGDIILVTMKAKNATLGGASIEWGAEI